MIYVIDHNDSFTHNVVHQFSLFDDVECDNYNEIDKKKLQKARVIVFSPGPGNPRDYPTTSKIYKQFKGIYINEGCYYYGLSIRRAPFIKNYKKT